TLACSRGRYGQAVQVLGHLNQPNSQSLAFLAASHAKLGDRDAAAETLRRLLHLEPDVSIARMTASLPYKDRTVPALLADELRGLGIG
ncbi:MAG TPA: hypothetical protein VKN76_04840, partial [Kiloniellaceae bacterium]|nr:hypothetical protein [Kiloniellaceae bacterium]